MTEEPKLKAEELVLMNPADDPRFAPKPFTNEDLYQHQAKMIRELQSRISELETKIEILENPSDGRCMEVGALREEVESLSFLMKKDLEQYQWAQEKLSIAKEALEFYADSFAIMDHVDGNYSIKDEWYMKAREALERLK